MHSFLDFFQKKLVSPSAQRASDEVSPSLPLSSDSQPAQSWSALQDGQLLVDMFERPYELVVRAFVAGVDPGNIEINVANDMLTIRGIREECEEIHEDKYLARECYWGSFSRSLIIPVPVDQERIRAYFKNGVVTIELPKQKEQNLITLSEEEQTTA